MAGCMGSSSSFPPKVLWFLNCTTWGYTTKGLKNPQTHPNVIDFKKNHHDSLIVCWWHCACLYWAIPHWGVSENGVYPQMTILRGIMIFNQWIQWGTKYFHTNPFPTCELGWPARPALWLFNIAMGNHNFRWVNHQFYHLQMGNFPQLC